MSVTTTPLNCRKVAENEQHPSHSWYGNLTADEPAAYHTCEGFRLTPEVGMGATYAVGSDRYACTIVEVLRFKSGARKGQIRGLVVQDDEAILTSGSEQDGSAKYRYERNTNASRDTFLWTERTERFTLKGNGWTRLGLGHRTQYRDPSF